MKHAHYGIVRAGSRLAGHTGALIIGLAVVGMASAPRPAWCQSAWPTYPNNNAISVTSGGNVGIGTTVPLDTLHVAGGFRVANPIFGGNGFTFAQDSTGNLQIQYKNPTQLFANIMALTYYGNVGIGTTNATYRLTVEGAIGAREVIVTNAPWSDYVFQPGYRLRPLSEVDAYIQAHHRLPDIPSEAEVKENGVSLGDIQAKLLAKVEELTLHMIQQEKANQELRGRIARLEQDAASATAAK